MELNIVEIIGIIVAGVPVLLIFLTLWILLIKYLWQGVKAAIDELF
ncbi:hypothetical protein [Parabacteroides goldsteinii]